MRHRFKVKQFSRRKKHRDAMFRNLVQELVIHERIFTTYQKAKYLVPLANKVITKAKVGGRKAHVSLGKIFYTGEAAAKAVRELAPRFKDQQGPYTRVVKSHIRHGDKAQMAYIEYIGNPIEIYEQENRIKEQEKKNLPTFWEWEMKILEQEKEFYENEVMRLTGQAPPQNLIEEGAQDDEVDQIDEPKEETKEETSQNEEKIETQAEDLYAKSLAKSADSPIVDMSGVAIENLSGPVANQLKHLERNIMRVTLDIEHHLRDKDRTSYRSKYEPF